MPSILKFVGLLLFIVSFSSCLRSKVEKSPTETTTKVTPTAPAATQRAFEPYTMYKIVQINGQKLESTQLYTLQFLDNSLKMNLDVNECNGNYKATKDSLIFPYGIDCTERCCDNDITVALLQILNGGSHFSFDKNYLKLSSPKGTVLLRGGAQSIAGKDWKVRSITDLTTKQTITFAKQKPIFKFGWDKTFVQFSANRCNTSYLVASPQSIRFVNKGMLCTRKCCDTKDEIMLSKALTGAFNYKFDLDSLSLSNNNFNILLDAHLPHDEKK